MTEEEINSLQAQLATLGQTVETLTTEGATAKGELEKAQKQVEEKQTLIDGHRTEMATVKEEIEKLKNPVAPVKKEEPKVETPTAEQIKADNDASIAAMSVEDRQKFTEAYEGMTEEQQKYLVDPTGMATFLKERVQVAVASSNPFAPVEAKPDPKAQFDALFGGKQTSPVGKVKGVGLQSDVVVKVTNADVRSEQIEKARMAFNV